jgi:hypothetical protein
MPVQAALLLHLEEIQYFQQLHQTVAAELAIVATLE